LQLTRDARHTTPHLRLRSGFDFDEDGADEAAFGEFIFRMPTPPPCVHTHHPPPSPPRLGAAVTQPMGLSQANGDAKQQAAVGSKRRRPTRVDDGGGDADEGAHGHLSPVAQSLRADPLVGGGGANAGAGATTVRLPSPLAPGTSLRSSPHASPAPTSGTAAKPRGLRSGDASVSISAQAAELASTWRAAWAASDAGAVSDGDAGDGDDWVAALDEGGRAADGRSHGTASASKHASPRTATPAGRSSKRRRATPEGEEGGVDDDGGAADTAVRSTWPHLVARAHEWGLRWDGMRFSPEASGDGGGGKASRAAVMADALRLRSQLATALQRSVPLWDGSAKRAPAATDAPIPVSHRGSRAGRSVGRRGGGGGGGRRDTCHPARCTHTITVAWTVCHARALVLSCVRRVS
jgi:hypothetical protein